MVLSSVFSSETLETIRNFRVEASESERAGWVRLESQSWVKGSDAAKAWCVENDLQQIPIGTLPYEDVLRVLSRAEGLVYLPAGGDTCPRLVIEAKLLGCKLRLNDHVQHRREEWFSTDDLGAIEDYLANATSVFWTATKNVIERRPTISGYTTTHDCIRQKYPYERCITSMLAFCDQVVIVDGGSTDGTWEILQKLERTDPSRIIAVQRVRDWSDPSFALFDGEQKAHARSLCTGDFCWQMDCDEIVHENDAEKIKHLAAEIPRGVEIVSLPVIEYWGGADKVRVDVMPWKWRLSRNDSRITHGVPSSLRRVDSSGRSYAASGTDGCDMIYADTGEPVPHVNFYTSDIDAMRRSALQGDVRALESYQAWFNSVVSSLPSVFHYSWFDIERKIKLYRDYWTQHWQSLYGEKLVDSAENNMMFDAPWSAVSDSMIHERAEQMRELLGGWIWHRKWDGKTATPSIRVDRSQPTLAVQEFEKSR
jgi:glycosyltransferase involved in cell wall biosynthesis